MDNPPPLEKKPGSSNRAAYALAWLATFVGGPLGLAVTVMSRGGGFDAAVSIFQVGWAFWGVPMTLAGALAWIVLHKRLARIARPLQRKDALRLVGYGVVLGAGLSALVGLVPALWFMATAGYVSVVPIYVGYAALVGVVTGISWSGWYIAFDLMLRPKPKP